MDGPARLQVNLLGKLTASYDDAALDLGGPRQRAVLAILLLARGEVVPAEHLADLVWAERAPANPAGALQSYVSHLRRQLQPGSAAWARGSVIVREGHGYAVRLPPDAVDAWRFESLLEQADASTHPDEASAMLRAGLALWKGPPLADHADEQWAQTEIARLTELRNVARERLVAVRLEVGESAMLVPEIEALVSEAPLREERWRLLVLALYRAHRQADALGALRSARTKLAEELGVDPGPALRALEAEVLAHSPALEVPSQRAPVVRGLLPGVPVTADDLVDRDRELLALRKAVDDLAAGMSGLLLVEGPAGIGKSRLLAEARGLATRRSVQVMSGRGSDLECAFAFGVVRQLFEPALAGSDHREDVMTGAATGALGVFDLADGDREDGSFAVLHGLYRLAVNLAASGPLMLSVDDVQWCDRASLRFLSYLVRRLDGVPVLVVASVRTDEPHTHQEVLDGLAMEPTAVVVRPGALSAEATAAIVERRLGEHPAPRFVAACHQTTSGNPLLVQQLVTALEANRVRPDASHADMAVAVGSRAISSMVLLRLRRLPEEVVAVARAAAVLGDGAPSPSVAALAGLAENTTAAALAALARAEIIKDEQPLAFVHPLVRDAVYRDLPAAERELRHEEAASVLRAAHRSEEQVAAHLLLAPPRGDEDTVALLRAAARTAADRGASESAVIYLRRALAESPAGPDRHSVLAELGKLEASVEAAAGEQAAHEGSSFSQDGHDTMETTHDGRIS